jgi:hypothetical protein
MSASVPGQAPATASAVAALGSPVAAASVGPIVFTLLNSAGQAVGTPVSVTQGATDTTSSASFLITAPDTYTVSAQRFDASGAAVGAAVVSPAFTVTAAQVSVTVPVSVSVTVA